MKIQTRIAVSICLITALSVSAQAVFAQKNSLSKSIDSALERYFAEGKLNGNVLVGMNGSPIYERSFGFADGAKREGLTKEFRFNIGSIYKEFPAVAIMKLVEKGQLGIHDPVRKYLPHLPKWSAKVSVKHLLQYSSGLPRIRWDEYFRGGGTIGDDDIARDLSNITQLEFEPGSDYLYTNYSPIILMKVVEAVTKKSFRDDMAAELFRQNGMTNTVIKAEYPYKDKNLMAIPFNREFKEDSFRTTASSVLFSATTTDLFSWMERLAKFKVIAKASVRFLSETAKEGENIQSPLGSAIWSGGKLIEHTHHGATANYEGIVRRFEPEGLTIVILTNQKHGNVYEISERIRAIVSVPRERLTSGMRRRQDQGRFH